MILFSIIALEKFAQTTENKITIQKRLQEASASLDNLHKTSETNHIDGENNQLNSIFTLPKGNGSLNLTNLYLFNQISVVGKHHFQINPMIFCR